jgi:AcrR family transcriptional regulator
MPHVIETSRKSSPERRRRMLNAARYLVLRQGLRATTMEAIAREAGVAKPTLYSYFPDKDAVFRAIVEDLMAAVLTGFNAALHGQGDAVSRVGAALAAKYKTIARLLEGSPHAEELYSEHERSAAAMVRQVEQQVERAIAEVLAAAGIDRSRQLTQLLLAGAYGIGRKATSPAEIGPAIRLLTERLLRPELG